MYASAYIRTYVSCINEKYITFLIYICISFTSLNVSLELRIVTKYTYT
jgi:hypothetical protein